MAGLVNPAFPKIIERKLSRLVSLDGSCSTIIVKLLKSLLVLHLRIVLKVDKVDLVVVLEVVQVDQEVAYHQLLLHQSTTVIKMVLT